MADFETLQDFAEASADESYAFFGRNSTSSNNDVVLTYMLIRSFCLHCPHAYAFVTETSFSF